MELTKLCIYLSCLYLASGAVIREIHPDFGLNTVAFIEKYGYPVESHEIHTEDGYILVTHRIPHGRNNRDDTPKPPVLLVPGVLCGSDIWVNTGIENSLGFILADQGYDVWLSNYRGTTWSRKHETLDPDQNKEDFFNYSFQEIGDYDLPANIDYILNVTQQEKLFYIGHSQGTTAFFALTSAKPEYNEKIRLSTVLAPVAYTANIDHLILNIMKRYLPYIKEFMAQNGIYEILPHSFLSSFAIQVLCNDDSFYQPLCGEILYFIGGTSTTFDESLVPVIGSNTPAGGSTRILFHYVQNSMTKQFQKYDFGEVVNMEVYGQNSPPLYNLTQVTAPVVMYYSNKDTLSTMKDVEKLKTELPNVVHEKYIEGFSHLDYLWSSQVVPLMYNDLVMQIKNHS